MTMSNDSTKKCPDCNVRFGLPFTKCPVCCGELAPVSGPAEPAPVQAATTKRHLRYIQRTAVRKLVGESGKRCSEEALVHLDEWIHRKIQQACRAHNGGRKTIDACVLGQVGIK